MNKARLPARPRPVHPPANRSKLLEWVIGDWVIGCSDRSVNLLNRLSPTHPIAFPASPSKENSMTASSLIASAAATARPRRSTPRVAGRWSALAIVLAAFGLMGRAGRRRAQIHGRGAQVRFLPPRTLTCSRTILSASPSPPTTSSKLHHRHSYLALRSESNRASRSCSSSALTSPAKLPIYCNLHS